MQQLVRLETEELSNEFKEVFDEEKELLSGKGFKHYGVFADAPEALKLFDEIEEERNKQFIEPA